MFIPPLPDTASGRPLAVRYSHPPRPTVEAGITYGEAHYERCRQNPAGGHQDRDECGVAAPGDRGSSPLHPGPTGRPAGAQALLPRAGAGGPRPDAGPVGRDHPDLRRSEPKGDRLPLGGVPPRAPSGQQPAQPADRGAGPHRTGRSRPGHRRSAGLRAGARPGQWWARPAGRLLPGLVGHPRASSRRIRDPLRVRHLRSGDPRRLAGGEDRQLAGRTQPVGDRQTGDQLSGRLGRAHRALYR